MGRGGDAGRARDGALDNGTQAAGRFVLGPPPRPLARVAKPHNFAEPRRPVLRAGWWRSRRGAYPQASATWRSLHSPDSTCTMCTSIEHMP